MPQNLTNEKSTLVHVMAWCRQAITWTSRSLSPHGALCHNKLNKWPQMCCWHKLLCIMMTSSNGNIFRVTGPLCGELTGPGEFPTQRPVTRSFDVFFDLRPNKRWSKQPWGWWFETLSWSLWRHCNVLSRGALHSWSHGSVCAQIRAKYSETCL